MIKFVVGDFDAARAYYAERRPDDRGEFIPYYESPLRRAHPSQFGATIAALSATGAYLPIWTNHPYHLDHVDADEVLVVCRDSSGAVRSKRLSEHREYEQWWKNEMDAGEFWSMVGEAWVAE